MLKYLMVMITIIFSVGCADSLLGPGVNESAAKADAAVSVVVAHMNKDEHIKPDNQSTVCSTCNGTGKVGDGRVSSKCMDCNGTGKVLKEAGPVQVPAAVPVAPLVPNVGYNEETIVKTAPGYSKILRVYGAIYCVPCQTFKNNKALIQELNRKGIFVNYIDIDKHPEVRNLNFGGKQISLIPFFVLEVNGVPTMWFEGGIDMNRL